MMISSREASRILGDHAGVGRQQSRRALARWPAADHASLLEACAGVLVVRLAPGEEPAPTDSWRERAEAVRVQPYLGFSAWLQVQARLAEQGALACVVTVCGYPVLLADLVSFEGADDQVRLGLDTPGEWSTRLHERRLVTSPGPRWLLLGEQPHLGRAARACERREPVNACRSTTWTRWA
jgi:hypothetical protein